jgi:hypothetical protein
MNKWRTLIQIYQEKRGKFPFEIDHKSRYKGQLASNYIMIERVGDNLISKNGGEWSLINDSIDFRLYESLTIYEDTLNIINEVKNLKDGDI